MVCSGRAGGFASAQRDSAPNAGFNPSASPRQLPRPPLKPADLPVYDFKQHTRAAATVHVVPKPIILVEGILIFVEPKLRNLCSMKLFVDTDQDICFIRRLQRDVTERGRTVDSVINQYMKTVRPSFIEFVEPTKRFADVIIPEGGHNTVAAEMVISRLKALLPD
ncbi:MAG: hypothetical protein WBJ23_08755 [Anaerolineaceae bacterium]